MTDRILARTGASSGLTHATGMYPCIFVALPWTLGNAWILSKVARVNFLALAPPLSGFRGDRHRPS